MKKKLSLIALAFFIMLQPSMLWPDNDVAYANSTATVNYDTSAETSYTENFRGYNSPLQKGAMAYLDDDYTDKLIDADVGWVRYGAGTVVGEYNWKLGEADDEGIAQYKAADKQYFGFNSYRRYTLAKGKQHLSDFYEMSRRTGTKVIFTVNTFTDTPDDIADLARYAKDNGIQVEYWQLGNEPYYFRYIGDESQGPDIYKGPFDYIKKMKEYNDAIKDVLPSAKTLLYYTPDAADSENNAFNTYESNNGRYWDGITFHRYNGNGGNLTNAIKNTNTYLKDWENTIDDYLAKSWSGAPIVITEYGTKINGFLENAHYTGIFIAESILRANKHPNIKLMAGYRGYGGLVTPANPQLTPLNDVFQDGQTADTTTWNFNVFSKGPALVLKVIDKAINNSDTLWATTVTGGDTVATDNSTMPAIYAQAYKGKDGTNYVVIINKSDTAHDVTIKEDNVGVSGTLDKSYVTAAPDAQNTPANPTNVQIQTGTTSNVVTVPSYSVMRVEWDSGRTAEVQPTRLTHAKVVDDGEVELKWWPLPGVSSYTVKYGTSQGGSYPNSVTSTDDTETISGLTGGPYYFVVYPGSASTALSNEMKVTLAKPATPTVTKAYPKLSGEIAIEWQSVPGARGYNVLMGTSAGNYTTTIDAGNTLGYKFTGLTDNTTYHFAVNAYNGPTNTSNGTTSGLSANSANYAVTASADMPYAPNNLRGTPVGSNGIKLEWDHSYREYIYDGFEDGSTTDTVKDHVNDLDGVWSVADGSFSIISHPSRANAKVYESGSTGSELSLTGQSNWGNYEVEATVQASSSWTGIAGVAARSDANGNNYYRLGLAKADCAGSTASGQQYIKLQKIVNGSNSGDLLCVATSDISSEYSGVSLTEATLTLKVNGSTLVSMLNQAVITDPSTGDPFVTDSGFSQGYPGVFSKNQEKMFDQFILRKTNTPLGDYKVYRSTSATDIYPGPGSLRATITSSPFLEYTDTGLSSGTQYYYRVIGSNSEGDSNAASNIVPYKP